jgi:hypothetical protein
VGNTAECPWEDPPRKSTGDDALALNAALVADLLSRGADPYMPDDNGIE